RGRERVVRAQGPHSPASRLLPRGDPRVLAGRRPYSRRALRDPAPRPWRLPGNRARQRAANEPRAAGDVHPRPQAQPPRPVDVYPGRRRRPAALTPPGARLAPALTPRPRAPPTGATARPSPRAW